MQYETVWRKISERFSLNTSIPSIYTEPDELSYITQQLKLLAQKIYKNSILFAEIPETELKKLEEEWNYQQQVAPEGHGLSIKLVHRIPESKRIVLYNAGSFVKGPRYRDNAAFHEFLHHGYLETYPQLTALNSLPILGLSPIGISLVRDYLRTIEEGVTWNSTLKLSHFADINRKDIREFFRYSMDVSSSDYRSAVTGLVEFLERQEEIINPLRLIEIDGHDTLRIAMRPFEHRFKPREKINAAYEKLLGICTHAIETVRNEYYIEVHRMAKDGSTIRIK